MKFLDLEDAYEKRPIITGMLVLASHFFFIPALLSWMVVTFPDHEISIVNISMWVWVAWMIISGVATFKYLKKSLNGKSK